MTPRRAMAGLAVAVAVAGVGVVGACGVLEPDVGPLLAGTCRDADTNPGIDVSFANDIRPLFQRRSGGCSCHVPSTSGPGTGTLLSGLDLGSLPSLRAGGVSSGNRIVVAMQPCASVLYLKVEQAPPFGSRMPLGGPFFTEEEKALLHDWIAEGALDN